MRKLIRNWLFGGDAKSWDDMFKIAVKAHESCIRLLKSNEYLLERFKDVSDRNIALLDAIASSTDIYQLKKTVSCMIDEWQKERGMNDDPHA